MSLFKTYFSSIEKKSNSCMTVYIINDALKKLKLLKNVLYVNKIVISSSS